MNAQKKEIPQMTGIPTILRNEDGFISFLKFIGEGRRSENECTKFIENIPGYNLSKSTIKNSLTRLKGYYFLERDEEDNYYLSDNSKEFLLGKLSYEDYILSCLCKNLEWSYFLEDIYDVVKEYGPLGISEILSHLRHDKRFGYTKKNWDRAYLVKILPLLDLVKVIKYGKSIAKIGERSREVWL